jgi:hypothetical protein
MSSLPGISYYYLNDAPGSSINSISKFELDGSGRATHLYQARTAYERVPWHQTPPAQLGLLALTVLVFLSAAVAWLIAVVRRRASGCWLSGLVGSLNLLFLAGLVTIMAPAATGGDIWQFFFAPSLPFLLVLSIPLATVALTLVVTALHGHGRQSKWWIRRCQRAKLLSCLANSTLLWTQTPSCS